MTENTILLLVALAQTIVAIPGAWVALRDLSPKQKRASQRSTLLTLAMPLLFTVLTWSAVIINYHQAATGTIDFDAVDKRWISFDYKIITGKRFNNETVRLDGIHFVDCVFTNSTLEFEGTAPFSISGNSVVEGNLLRVRSDNPIVKQTIKLLAIVPPGSLKLIETPEKLGR